MTKEKVIEKYEKDKSVSSGELIKWVRHISVKCNQPVNYKKGDVFIFRSSVGKTRPYVLYRVIKEEYILIPLSTTEDVLNAGTYNSRFFGSGFFSKSLITLHTDMLKGNFIGVLEDSRGLNEAFKNIKKHFNIK